ncbi:hypothetical protein OAE71_00375 [Synechococcus sp. AH-551-A21]|nr:hypothetical protein [Synechococcus sp. AH-551-A21]MDB4677599.1 hypothetical protein [Synechococcus sp. AH-551-A21]
MESAWLSSSIANMVPWLQKEIDTEPSERTRPKALNKHWQPMQISKQTNQGHSLDPNSTDKTNDLQQE